MPAPRTIANLIIAFLIFALGVASVDLAFRTLSEGSDEHQWWLFVGKDGYATWWALTKPLHTNFHDLKALACGGIVGAACGGLGMLRVFALDEPVGELNLRT